MSSFLGLHSSNIGVDLCFCQFFVFSFVFVCHLDIQYVYIYMYVRMLHKVYVSI